MVDLFNYFRRETTEVNIGAVLLGGPNSIRVQSMTNTSTQDTQACVEQAKRIVDAGGEYVRLTTQGIKAVSYTHLDVYKRQEKQCASSITKRTTFRPNSNLSILFDLNDSGDI